MLSRLVSIVVLILALDASAAPRAVAPVNEQERIELRLKAGDSIRVVTEYRALGVLP